MGVIGREEGLAPDGSIDTSYLLPNQDEPELNIDDWVIHTEIFDLLQGWRTGRAAIKSGEWIDVITNLIIRSILTAQKKVKRRMEFQSALFYVRPVTA